MIREIEMTYKPITQAECARTMADILQFYWEVQLDSEALLRQQALWYQVLKPYSLTTINKVAIDWLKNGKRKPMPADFLELANEIDDTPEFLSNLKRYKGLPIIEIDNINTRKVVGCPVRLAEMIRFSDVRRIDFHENDQMDYLYTGQDPVWFIPSIKQDVEGIPTREELLAMMTPEERVSAVKKDDQWKSL